MSTFKVGDVVRCNDPQEWSGLLYGREYTVEEIEGKLLRVCGLEKAFFCHRFDKVNKLKGNIK